MIYTQSLANHLSQVDTVLVMLQNLTPSTNEGEQIRRQKIAEFTALKNRIIREIAKLN